MGRTARTSSFSFGPNHTTPVAVIQPPEQFVVLGGQATLDGSQSYSEDGLDVSFEWVVLDAPIGSLAAELVPIFPSDPRTVQLKADVVGPYRVGLTVRTAHRTSVRVESVVYVQVVEVPHSVQVTPDGEFFFKVVSDFWRLLENRDVLPITWSAYKQLVANDFLRMWQWEYGRSIRNIQELIQRQWISLRPGLALDGAQATYVLGNHQRGATAFTPAATSRVRGVILGALEYRVVKGGARDLSGGGRLSIYEGANAGTYDVLGPTADYSGFLLSSTTPLPDPDGDTLTSGADLAFITGSAVAVSPTVDFVAAGVQVGDLLRISDGQDAGLHVVSAVGVADGLPSDMYIAVEAEFVEARASVSFAVVRPVGATVSTTTLPLVDTVYIPEADADFSGYSRAGLSGTASIPGPYEILVEQRHAYAALVGKKISITSGPGAGSSLTLVALNQSGTGFLTSAPLPAPFPGVVAYTIPVVTDISSRLLVLDGQAYEIASVVLEENHIEVGAGGPGPVWAVRLLRSEAPASRSGLAWSVASTMTTLEHADVELLGVRPGDVIEFEVVRTDLILSTRIRCEVLGARGNKIAFSWGVAGEDTFGDDVILDAAHNLHLALAMQDPAGALVLDGLALQIVSEIESFDFQARYWNLESTAETQFVLGGMTFTAKAVSVIRNSQVPASEDLVYVPRLQEFIVDPEGQVSSETGEYVYVAKDQTTVRLPRPPVLLVEGRDYFIGGQRQTRGTSATVSAGSDVVYLFDGDLIRRMVRTGDVLELLDGPAPGRYVIQEVQSSTIVRVLGEDGSLPTEGGAAISYVIDRRVDGRFVYFTAAFAPDASAPDTLWAPLSFWDGAQYLEDNYGSLVGVTKAQLDAFGTSQITYRGAVKGLLYAWTGARSMQAIVVGASILAGLPVSEDRAVVRDVDPNYRSGRGRILLEVLDPDGRPTGTVVPYFYAADLTQSEASYAGLAINPATGAEYRVGDVVEENMPLTRGVQIRDWISHPDWWAGAGAVAEVQKVHAWELSVDAEQIDARDLALVHRFAMAVRDLRTFPSVVLVRYLYDEVSVLDDLFLEVDENLYDDPALGVEATHMVGSYAASTSLRKLGFPTVGLRTLFEGHDLVTSSGSGVMTSARGGFVDALDQVSAAFPAVLTLGEGLIRPGDILSIFSGPNAGRYEVTSVDSDTQITVTQTAIEYPPVSPEIAGVVADSAQRFAIERPLVNPLVAANSLTTMAATNLVSDGGVSGNFLWNGVKVGDYLLVLDGADRGRYQIYEVADSVLMLGPDVVLVGDAGAQYRIERLGLLQNPLVAGTDGVLVAGERRLTTAGTSPDLYALRATDELRVLTGADAGRVFRVTDVVGDEIWIDGTFSANEAGIEFEVVRPALAGSEDGIDSDSVLAEMFLDDPVRATYFRPTQALAGGPYTIDTFVDGIPGALTWLVDVQAAGAVPGMLIEVTGTTQNVGVYELLTAATTTTEVVGVESWPVPGAAAGETAEFLQDVAAFTLLNDTVQLAGASLEFLSVTAVALSGNVTGIAGAVVTGLGTSFDTEVVAGDLFKIDADGAEEWTRVLSVDSATQITLVTTYYGPTLAGAASKSAFSPGVRPGDRFVCPDGDFGVAHVASDTVTLTSDTGAAVPTASTGRFERILW